jgi:multicomponent Na+:H+ antiporter subunit E
MSQRVVEPAVVEPARVLSAATRGAGLLGFWVVLAGTGAADLAVGVAAAAAATGVSLWLLPPRGARPSPVALAAAVLRTLRQSVVAGFDVALRALDPRLPLQPGFVVYSARLPPGPARNAFCVLVSLAPGTLPAGVDADGALIVHCLDCGQPVAAQLAMEDQRLCRALGYGDDDE